MNRERSLGILARHWNKKKNIYIYIYIKTLILIYSEKRKILRKKGEVDNEGWVEGIGKKVEKKSFAREHGI